MILVGCIWGRIRRHGWDEREEFRRSRHTEDVRDSMKKTQRGHKGKQVTKAANHTHTSGWRAEKWQQKSLSLSLSLYLSLSLSLSLTRLSPVYYMSTILLTCFSSLYLFSADFYCYKWSSTNKFRICKTNGSILFDFCLPQSSYHRVRLIGKE